MILEVLGKETADLSQLTTRGVNGCFAAKSGKGKFDNEHGFLLRSDSVHWMLFAELEVEGLDFTSSTKILQKKGFPQKKYRSIYKITAGNPLLLEIFEHNRKSKRYIYEEIFTQLTPEEQKVMEILSTGRTPVPYNAFFINNKLTLAENRILYP